VYITYQLHVSAIAAIVIIRLDTIYQRSYIEIECYILTELLPYVLKTQRGWRSLKINFQFINWSPPCSLLIWVALMTLQLHGTSEFMNIALETLSVVLFQDAVKWEFYVTSVINEWVTTGWIILTGQNESIRMKPLVTKHTWTGLGSKLASVMWCQLGQSTAPRSMSVGIRGCSV